MSHNSGENLRRWVCTFVPRKSNTRQSFKDRAFPRVPVSNHCNCRQHQVVSYIKLSQAVNKINARSDLSVILVVQAACCCLLDLNSQLISCNLKISWFQKQTNKNIKTTHPPKTQQHLLGTFSSSSFSSNQSVLHITVHPCTFMLYTDGYNYG